MLYYMQNMKTIVLGIGNTLRTDDGFGIYVVRELQKQNLPNNITCVETETGGFNLIDHLQGYDKAIIIDVIMSSKNNPGEILELSMDDIGKSEKLCQVHEIDLPTALSLGKKLGLKMPDDIKIYACVAKDIYTINEKCTESVNKAINNAVELICSGDL